ncbi:MAG: hypothetical protein IPO92_16530 [Saprospiraceae bacterium]|nr:hypothetical protein [Saprospiraceae bacterium]
MKQVFFSLCLMASCHYLSANNIQITNISLNAGDNTIEFDVSWENSWRSDILNNWDAAHVFFKYKALNGSWQPLILSNVNSVVPVGYASTVFSTFGFSTAIFYRSAIGGGTSNLLNVRLGIPVEYATGQYDIKGFAIEMVYIPQAAFYRGDGASTNSFTPSQITSISTMLTDPIGSVAVNYAVDPFNGFSSFYCMKYELSQGGYRDFLNSLTYEQQQNHIQPAPNAAAGTYALFNAYRNHIKIKTSGSSPSLPAVFGCDADNDGTYDEDADGENIACNFLNWVDQAAYLIWAGMQPLSELEYEKAARGVQTPSAGEYVWGNTNLANAPYILSSSDLPNETVSNGSNKSHRKCLLRYYSC